MTRTAAVAAAAAAVGAAASAGASAANIVSDNAPYAQFNSSRFYFSTSTATASASFVDGDPIGPWPAMPGVASALGVSAMAAAASPSVLVHSADGSLQVVGSAGGDAAPVVRAVSGISTPLPAGSRVGTYTVDAKSGSQGVVTCTPGGCLWYVP